jgi:hypothetical protein
MSSILADQWRPRMSPNAGGWGGGGGVSANENSCAHGAQTNFRDLTPNFIYEQQLHKDCTFHVGKIELNKLPIVFMYSSNFGKSS